MESLKRAIEIAFEAHKDQKDKYGEPYFGHVCRVMAMGRTEEEKICGVLHDVVEDSHWTIDDLIKEGFSREVTDAVACLSKTSEDENYEMFIERIAGNRLASVVKLNDLLDNMDIRRITELNDNDLKRLNKYLSAYRRLSKILTNDSKSE